MSIRDDENDTNLFADFVTNLKIIEVKSQDLGQEDVGHPPDPELCAAAGGNPQPAEPPVQRGVAGYLPHGASLRAVGVALSLNTTRVARYTAL